MSAGMADTTLSFNDGRQADPTSFLIKDGQVLMQGKSPQGGEFGSIYDSKKNHFLIVDYGRQNYYVMDKTLLNKQIKLMEDMRAQMKQGMEAQLQQLPPEQKKMMQQRMDAMLNPPKPPPMKITKTGKAENINGINCTQFDVHRGEEKIREVCVAKTSALKISETDYNTLRDMFAYMKEMAETLAKQSPMGSDDGAMMADMDGIPVEMRDLRQGFVSRLEGVSNDNINPSLFQIPSTFQQVDPYAMMQQQMQQMRPPQ
jgi:hypothetical protein